MNPDKLFDYLDGKLSPADRAEVEAKLASEPQLQRQLGIAREIHRGMRGSQEPREVLAPIDDPAVAERGARAGRRIFAACIALVLLNVLIGLTVISVKSRKPTKSGAHEEAIRQQLAASLDATAQKALPAPSFAAAEIKVTAPKTDWESSATKIIAAAEACGGSAVRGLPDQDALVVVADVPAAREAEFRRLFGAPPGVPEEPVADANARTIVQVRIAEAAQ